jgi:apolipoprotein N-acyltransferase
MLSKNTMGVASTLILVILLSQSRVFDFLIDTALGRIILILFILGISHMHKILGVVAVLFIIIMINQSDTRLFEGFTPPANPSSANAQQIQTNLQQKKQTAQNNLANQSATTTTSSTSATSSDSFVGGREGFNMIDREGTMLKGKRSNEVPVLSNSRTQTDDVEPSDKSVFTNAYTSV